MYIVQYKTNLCQLRASLQSEGRENVERSRVVYEVTTLTWRNGGNVTDSISSASVGSRLLLRRTCVLTFDTPLYWDRDWNLFNRKVFLLRRRRTGLWVLCAVLPHCLWRPGPPLSGLSCPSYQLSRQWQTASTEQHRVRASWGGSNNKWGPGPCGVLTTSVM